MREDLKERIERNEGFVLGGTLWPKHYQASRLPDAINLHPREIDRAKKMPPDKGRDRRVLQDHTAPPTRRPIVNWRPEAAPTSELCRG